MLIVLLPYQNSPTIPLLSFKFIALLTIIILHTHKKTSPEGEVFVKAFLSEITEMTITAGG